MIGGNLAFGMGDGEDNQSASSLGNLAGNSAGNAVGNCVGNLAGNAAGSFAASKGSKKWQKMLMLATSSMFFAILNPLHYQITFCF